MLANTFPSFAVKGSGAVSRFGERCPVSEKSELSAAARAVRRLAARGARGGRVFIDTISQQPQAGLQGDGFFCLLTACAALTAAFYYC